MTRLALIGPGRVGKTLVQLLPKDKVRLGAVLSRDLTSARRAVRLMKRGSAARTLQRLNEADVVLIAVPEPALDGVVEQLSQVKVDYQDKVILHTSTTHGSEALAPLETLGAAVGSLQPLYIFQSPVLTLSGVYFVYEGTRVAAAVARQLVRELGAEFQLVKADHKANHTVAVSMASDLLTGLLEGATRQMMTSGFTRRRALAAISPVVEATMEEYARSGRNSRPGPLLQRSRIAAEQYLPALQAADPEAAEHYRSLSALTLRVLGRDKEAGQLASDT